MLRGLYFFFLLITVFLNLDEIESAETQKPNIIVILADDLGWNDVGFHNSKMFQTPNIDALAFNGVILNRFYSAHLCTPSRTALMTGKFPIYTGMQQDVLTEAEPRGLPLDFDLLPQYLKTAGYKTHLVGKWHLGFFSQDYHPTKRGFDSFFGYYNGHQDYFTHRVYETRGEFQGYDLHDGLDTFWENENIYGTDLYTTKAVDLIRKHDKSSPLFLLLSQIAVHAGENSSYFQAPQEEIDKFDYIQDDPNRKIFAAMVSKLDQSVAEVVSALNENRILDNSIILFMSDNGAPTFGIYETTGSNYPLRGIKDTYFEGGTRLPAVIWSPYLKSKQTVSNIMMHMVDILPTLCGAAGILLSNNVNIDGIDMWSTLQTGSENSIRNEFPYNIDPSESDTVSGAIRMGEWKYYKGNSNTTGEKYMWPSDKYGKKSYNYNISEYYANILESPVNTIMTSFISKSLHLTTNEINKCSSCGETPLTAEKIGKLKTIAEVSCNDLSLPICVPSYDCLINLNDDPCERYNFAQTNKKIYKIMKEKFEIYRRNTVPPSNMHRDKCANPQLWGDQWINWYDVQAVVVQYNPIKGTAERIYARCYAGLLSFWYYIYDGITFCINPYFRYLSTMTYNFLPDIPYYFQLL